MTSCPGTAEEVPDHPSATPANADEARGAAETPLKRNAEMLAGQRPRGPGESGERAVGLGWKRLLRSSKEKEKADSLWDDFSQRETVALGW